MIVRVLISKCSVQIDLTKYKILNIQQNAYNLTNLSKTCLIFYLLFDNRNKME